jgi:hypothetical protein
MGMAASMGFVFANASQGSAAAKGTVKPSPIAVIQPAFAPKWTPNTAFELGHQVISPNNDVVSAKVAHTSSAAYASDTAKWTLSDTYARVVSGLRQGAGNAAANLAILNAVSASLGTVGGTIIINTPGEYQISDSWNLDMEDIHLHLGAGVHLFTASATSSGGAVVFVGYLGTGTALTPQRNSATLSGSGKISGWLGGSNENAVGAVRYKRFTILPGLTFEGGNKGVTSQYGVEDVNIQGVHIPSAGRRGISIEQQGGSIHAVVKDIKVGVTGEEAVSVAGDIVKVEGITVVTAFNTFTPDSMAAVHIYARDGGTLSQAQVSDINVTEANGGKGVLISSVNGTAKVRNVCVGHSGGAATEFYNCTGLNVAEEVNAPNSASVVVGTGTTRTAILRGADPLEASALACGEASLPRYLMNTATLSMPTGYLRLSYFTARKSETVNNVRWLTGSTPAGPTPTIIRIGLYDVANNGDLTLVASTGNDTTLMRVSNASNTKPLGAPYAKIAGHRYALGMLVVTVTTAPTVCGNCTVGGIGAEAGQSPKLTAALAAQTDLPIRIADSAASASTAAPYIVISP